MTWSALIGAWSAWLHAADRSPLTIRLRVHQLGQFAEAHPDGPDVSAEELTAWLARPDWSTETRRSNRAALRVFYGWAAASGHLAADPSTLLPAIRPASHVARPAPEDVARAAMEEPGRVGLMLTLAARQGLRRGEIARLHSEDITRDLLGWSLRVHGKGRRDRVIPLADDVADRLRLARPGGWVFPNAQCGHLSADYVGRLMARALPRGWTAHTLRHRFATVAYYGTRDLVAVQTLLGHSRPETTRQYIRLPEDALRDAVRAAA